MFDGKVSLDYLLNPRLDHQEVSDSYRFILNERITKNKREIMAMFPSFKELPKEKFNSNSEIYGTVISYNNTKSKSILYIIMSADNSAVSRMIYDGDAVSDSQCKEITEAFIQTIKQ